MYFFYKRVRKLLCFWEKNIEAWSKWVQIFLFLYSGRSKFSQQVPHACLPLKVRFSDQINGHHDLNHHCLADSVVLPAPVEPNAEWYKPPSIFFLSVDQYTRKLIKMIHKTGINDRWFDACYCFLMANFKKFPPDIPSSIFSFIECVILPACHTHFLSFFPPFLSSSLNLSAFTNENKSFTSSLKCLHSIPSNCFQELLSQTHLCSLRSLEPPSSQCST